MNYDNMIKDIKNALTERRIGASVYQDGAFIQVEINWGDWKHEHLSAKLLVERMIKGFGYEVWHSENLTETDGGDCYSAIHTFLPIDLHID